MAKGVRDHFAWETTIGSQRNSKSNVRVKDGRRGAYARCSPLEGSRHRIDRPTRQSGELHNGCDDGEVDEQCQHILDDCRDRP